MKKLLRCVLALALCLTLFGGAAMAETLSLPEDSSTFSPELAAQTLSLFGTDAQTVRQAMANYGLTIVQEAHYDKSPEDPSHTCAYTVGMGQVTYAGEPRTLLVVAIRGTTAGEWYSNFDFAPSHSNETQFAENFLMAAQDVYLGLQSVLGQVQNPLVLVTGHSRGAACANLLSLFLNAACGPQNVFVYTSATPTTVRGEIANTDCPNVFNLINPADLVPMMPLTGWGYARLGQDVTLPGDQQIAETLQQAMSTLHALSQDIASYYNVRHSLTGPGESEDGLTVSELMQAVAQSMLSLSEQSPEADASALPQVAEDSDLAPLMRMLSDLFGSDGDQGAQILQQHMPALYGQLLAAMN